MLAGLAGCGFVREEQLSGIYWLVAVDSPESTMVCRRTSGTNCDGDELPGPSVFAAGADRRYVTIARHPEAPGSAPNKSVTEYYYVIRRRDDEALHRGAVVGPLTKEHFEAVKDRLHLPALTRIIKELR
jgi:hypothetical protein